MNSNPDNTIAVRVQESAMLADHGCLKRSMLLSPGGSCLAMGRKLGAGYELTNEQIGRKGITKDAARSSSVRTKALSAARLVGS